MVKEELYGLLNEHIVFIESPDRTVASAYLSKLNGREDNKFCLLRWDEGNQTFEIKLTEGSLDENGITVKDDSVTVTDSEGDLVTLSFLSKIRI